MVDSFSNKKPSNSYCCMVEGDFFHERSKLIESDNLTYGLVGHNTRIFGTLSI